MFCSKCGRETTENAAFCAGCGTGLAGVQPAKKTQLSLAAGIIDIAAGGLSLVSILFMVVFLLVVFSSGSSEGMPFFIVLFPLAMLIPSVLAIVGGIFALRRRSWVMALIGSIGLIVTSSVAGVAALVLTVMAKDEFEQGQRGMP